MRKLSQRVIGLILGFVLVSPAGALDGGMESLRATGKAFAEVAKGVFPSVVYVQVEGKTTTKPLLTPFSEHFGEGFPFGEDFFKRFFGESMPGLPRAPHRDKPAPQQRIVGQGSGFVYASKDRLFGDKSYILTNNHVIEKAEKIRVHLQDGREFEATVKGSDPRSDIAILAIDTADIPALKLADSTNLEVGEWVVAVGNPFGLTNTLTVGVVSAKGRTSVGINDYEDFIQTDAAINPGNSGGPLVNLNGEVVGMNTAIFSRSGGYMGVGFAIPSNLIVAIADQLIDAGEVTRGYLGVMIQSLTPSLADSFGFDDANGVLIAEVRDDTPAARAGMQEGDVVIAYRGRSVQDVGQFRNAVALTAPGETATVTVWRDGKPIELSVTIGKLTEDVVAEGPAQSDDALGLTVQTLTAELAEQFDTKAGEGVVVTAVERGSIAALAGISTGTLILEVDRKPVTNAAEFMQAVRKRRNDGHVLLLIRKNNQQRYVALSWN